MRRARSRCSRDAERNQRGHVERYGGSCNEIHQHRRITNERFLSVVASSACGWTRRHGAPRLMAGGVFLSEGILKFVYANQGVGRFTKLGFPWPHFTATFVGGLEIVGGLMLIAGLLTRL